MHTDSELQLMMPCVLCRSKEVGLVYVIWLVHVPMVIVLDSEGIKVSERMS